jgi:hypothetical protein
MVPRVGEWASQICVNGFTIDRVDDQCVSTGPKEAGSYPHVKRR